VTLEELYKAAVAEGIANDPRGEAVVRNELELRKSEYNKLSESEQKEYDVERLVNPYDDTRILYGAKDTKVMRAIVGIDMEGPELLLADRLNTLGKKIDVVISHHPEGHAYANFYRVMGIQPDILANAGVPINIAEGLMDKRMHEVERKVMPANHMRAVDTARMLGIPFMCMHTVCDNCVASYLKKYLDDKKPSRLKDLVECLKEIPEYKLASRECIGPKIIVGSEDRRSGKIYVDMTGGTEGPPEILNKMSESGISTVVAMHMSEDHIKKAKEANLNVVIAGHMASDTLGVNLLLGKIIRKFGAIEILSCSGYRYLSRTD